jgi:hypothetical protein
MTSKIDPLVQAEIYKVDYFQEKLTSAKTDRDKVIQNAIQSVFAHYQNKFFSELSPSAKEQLLQKTYQHLSIQTEIDKLTKANTLLDSLTEHLKGKSLEATKTLQSRVHTTLQAIKNIKRARGPLETKTLLVQQAVSKILSASLFVAFRDNSIMRSLENYTPPAFEDIHDELQNYLERLSEINLTGYTSLLIEYERVREELSRLPTQIETLESELRETREALEVVRAYTLPVAIDAFSTLNYLIQSHTGKTLLADQAQCIEVITEKIQELTENHIATTEEDYQSALKDEIDNLSALLKIAKEKDNKEFITGFNIVYQQHKNLIQSHIPEAVKRLEETDIPNFERKIADSKAKLELWSSKYASIIEA